MRMASLVPQCGWLARVVFAVRFEVLASLLLADLAMEIWRCRLRRSIWRLRIVMRLALRRRRERPVRIAPASAAAGADLTWVRVRANSRARLT